MSPNTKRSDSDISSRLIKSKVIMTGRRGEGGGNHPPFLAVAATTAVTCAISFYIYTQRLKRKIRNDAAQSPAHSTSTPSDFSEKSRVIYIPEEEPDREVDDTDQHFESHNLVETQISQSFENNAEPERTLVSKEIKKKEEPERTVTTEVLDDVELDEEEDDDKEDHKISLRIFSDKNETSTELCNFIVELAKEAIEERGVFHLAVQGGPLLDLLAPLSDHKDSIDFSKVVLSFANHYCINPCHETAALARSRSKFADAAGISQFITPTLCPKIGTDGSEEADFYMMLLQGHGLPHTDDGCPIVDLAVLALGSDGSVASCYPRSLALTSKRAVVGCLKKGEPASITFTMRTINHARKCVVVACSKSKREAVKRALTRPEDKPRGLFPAQQLKAPIFFLAADAAGSLEL